LKFPKREISNNKGRKKERKGKVKPARGHRTRQRKTGRKREARAGGFRKKRKIASGRSPSLPPRERNARGEVFTNCVQRSLPDYDGDLAVGG